MQNVTLATPLNFQCRVMYYVTGFLCGKCQKEDTSLGTALNLIECRTCGGSDIVVFTIICKSNDCTCSN